MENKGIKPAAFAKLCNTTKRTLHYYDEIGLFRPALIDRNGYRYYSQEQCDVFFTINCLTDIGMSLSEIREFSDSRTPASLRTVLLEQRQKVAQERQRLDRIESIINTKLEMVDQGLSLLSNEKAGLHPAPMQVELLQLPEDYYLVSDRLDTDDPQILLETLCRHINYHKEAGLHGGAPYSAILPRSDWEKNLHNYAFYSFRLSESQAWEMLTEAEVPPGSTAAVMKLHRQAGESQAGAACGDLEMRSEDVSVEIESIAPGTRLLIRPAGTYAVYFLRGDFHLAEEAISTLLEYAHKKGYEMGKYIYKEAVLDEVSEKNVEDYITRIAVRII